MSSRYLGWSALFAAASLVTMACTGAGVATTGIASTGGGTLTMPAPLDDGTMSVEEALAARRSSRSFTGMTLSIGEVSQLLWATQGVTEQGGAGRTAPSAGGTYPLEVFAATPDGVYHYVPDGHTLEVVAAGQDVRARLASAALDQEWIAQAPVVVVITAVFSRTEQRYGERAERYVHLEAGHAAQNLLLQAVALDLGAVPVGAFRDDEVRDVLGLPADHEPLYLIPVGHPAG